MSNHDGAERYQPRLNMWKRGALWEHLAPLPERQRHAEMLQLMERGLRLEVVITRLAVGTPFASIGPSSESGRRPAPPVVTRTAEQGSSHASPIEIFRNWEFNDP